MCGMIDAYLLEVESMSTQSFSDVESFYRYLGDHLGLGESQVTPEELLSAWRERREQEETVAAVEEGMRDAEAGRMRPLRELLDET
jgi:hypothetical protein